MLRNAVIHFYLHFLCNCFLRDFLHTVIQYKVFLSNINNLHTVVWLQVFLSNTNNLLTSILSIDEILTGTITP